MDGFNVIPVDKGSSPGVIPPTPTIGTQLPSDVGFEIVDEAKEAERKVEATSGGWIFALSIITLIGVILYFIFLVIYRISLLTDIELYGQEMKKVGENIDKKEMKEFQAMDSTLQTIDSRLQKHILSYQILNLINSNLRSNLQVTEYKLDVREKDIEVNLTVVSPSAKELAEQTEKFYQMKEKGEIVNYSVSNMSIEPETRRVKFSAKVSFSKDKVNAAAQNMPIQTEEPTGNVEVIPPETDVPVQN